MGVKFGSSSVESRIVEYMDEAVDRLTGGRLRISLWDAVPGRASTGELDDDTLDIVAMYTSDAADKTILSQVLSDGLVSAGTGLDAAEMINFLIHGEGQAFHSRAYEGTAYTGHVCGQLGPEIFGWSKTEIRNLSTFAGMTMRVPGGLVLQAYQALNPNAVAAPPPVTRINIVNETYDAWEWNSPYGDYTFLSSAATFDLRDSAYKHVYLAPLHQNSGIFDAVYKRTLFDSLPSDFRSALQTAAHEAAFRLYFARTVLNGPLVANLTAKADGWDVTVHESLPSDITTAFVAAIDSTLSEAIAGDADATAAIAAMRAHSDSIRAWRSANLRGEANLYSATHSVAP
jgi:TRAP-type mannitol/chloroaromatic compound transport system substrate-binding protein